MCPVTVARTCALFTVSDKCTNVLIMRMVQTAWYLWETVVLKNLLPKE